MGGEGRYQGAMALIWVKGGDALSGWAVMEGLRSDRMEDWGQPAVGGGESRLVSGLCDWVTEVLSSR